MTTATTVRSAIVIAALALSACSPPETRRARGGDSGADIGNRGAAVEMHAGSVIFPDRRCGVVGADCTGPLPLSGRERELDRPAREVPPLRPDPHVVEHMGEGGRVRRVVYEPPPDLSRPGPGDVEPAQPGPATGGGEGDEDDARPDGDTPPDPGDDERRTDRPTGPPDDRH
jgi:hypothetical protein